jgi:hypothetical protein
LGLTEKEARIKTIKMKQDQKVARTRDGCAGFGAGEVAACAAAAEPDMNAGWLVLM